MILLITRDGKAANDFLEAHNMDKSDVIVVKKVSDINYDAKGYVIIPPMPLNYQWSIRPKLVKLNNLTKYYNRLIKNF